MDPTLALKLQLAGAVPCQKVGGVRKSRSSKRVKQFLAALGLAGQFKIASANIDAITESMTDVKAFEQFGAEVEANGEIVPSNFLNLSAAPSADKIPITSALLPNLPDKLVDWMFHVETATVITDSENKGSEMSEETINATIKELQGKGGFICTHTGGFHSDEALAIAMLKLLPDFRKLPIVRSRNKIFWKAATVVVDVSGEYSKEKNIFDHHQKDYDQYYPGRTTTKLSAAGLIYRDFGKELVKTIAEGTGISANEINFEDDATLIKILPQLYANFIEEVDANDTGVDIADDYKYVSRSMLEYRVRKWKPTWQKQASAEEESSGFKYAMSMSAVEFYEQAKYFLHEQYPARKIVDQAQIEGRVMVLSANCPYADHLFAIEEEKKTPENEKVLYVVVGSGNKWKVEARPFKLGSYRLKARVPEKEALEQKVGEGIVMFVHPAGFTSQSLTGKEGAMAMAKAAVEIQA